MLGLRAREILECHKQSLLNHSGDSMEDQNFYGNSAKAQPCEGQKDLIGNWTRGHCITFCSCSEI